jgi:hypothetical protein
MGSSLPISVTTLVLLSLFAVYGQPNGASSDDNGEHQSSYYIFFKIPFFLLFTDICVSAIWSMWLISFLLLICLTGIKYCGWAAGGAFPPSDVYKATMPILGPIAYPLHPLGIADFCSLWDAKFPFI